ncbi:bacteriocin-like protein [Mucilaginibacter psychrotolerans]|uniref:bacteriocin-like protein n=1 Tax=Mucilaginibacter psychrotolerans TaxID=1524096 RepID=UPI0013052B52|nr:hypothetical protein [Mucilaginibacter psychrotolerans]
MKAEKKLTREEMKKVLGGTLQCYSVCVTTGMKECQADGGSQSSCIAYLDPYCSNLCS